MPTARRWLGLALALATGIAAAYIDTRPRFDDTGVLVVGLVAGGVVAALVAGRAAIGGRWLSGLAACPRVRGGGRPDRHRGDPARPAGAALDRLNVAPVLGIDHVLLSIPRGGEDQARAFYGGILGLREVPKPPPLDTHGGCWFVSPANEAMSIHLGVEEPFVPARKAHVALLIGARDALREAMRAGGVETIEDAETVTFDPFGNRLELIDARDAGFSSVARRAGSVTAT